METLDRGLVVLYNDDQDIYISWRLLNSDPANIAFNVYQYVSPGPPLKLNSLPINQTTDYIVSNSTHVSGAQYFVRSLIDSIEQEESKWVPVLNEIGQPYISIPMVSNVSSSRMGIADLDGDGTYDFILKTPINSLDPLNRPFNPDRGWIPSPGTYKIEAYGSNFSK